MRFFAARRGWRLLDLGELWRYRDLVWILGLRDFRVRYRQAFVGVAWAIVQPLATAAILALVFHLLGREPTVSRTPYLVSALCGLLLWQLFSHIVLQSTVSLSGNRHLVTKVYFPRACLPLSTTVVGSVDFIIGLGVLMLIMMASGVNSSWSLIAMPLMLLLAIAAAVAVGLWLAALNAVYRDVGLAVPFLIQTGFLASPVFYETRSLIPERWWPLYSLNPMAGILEGFRWSVLGGTPPPPGMLVTSVAVVSAALLGGLAFFRRMERAIADRI